MQDEGNMADDKLSTLEALVAFHKREQEARNTYSRTELVVLSTLTTLYAGARTEAAEYVRALPVGDALRPSVFELMDHNFRENSHSNVLEYLFRPSRSRNATDVWRAFLRSVAPAEAGAWGSEEYDVCREYPLHHNGEHGRIDLLVIDKKHKRLVAIENKVTAELGIRDGYGTQLDFYSAALKDAFPDFSSTRILLSHTPQEAVSAEWTVASYEHVLKALDEDLSGDLIVAEYRRLLLCILRGTGVDQLRAVRTKLDTNADLPFLNEMHQLKEYLHEIAPG
jgi:hypothetical protein